MGGYIPGTHRKLTAWTVDPYPEDLQRLRNDWVSTLVWIYATEEQVADTERDLAGRYAEGPPEVRYTLERLLDYYRKKLVELKEKFRELDEGVEHGAEGDHSGRTGERRI